ncbi:MAG: hypothetical protein ABSE21_17960 [Bryobacteraceae bacterium]|jgi:hypothetical protein
MSEKIGQGAQPSPVDGDIVMTLLDRLLVQLRVAEDGLKDLSREGMGSLGVSIDSATDELRAFQDKVRSAESKRLPHERLQSRMTAVKTLSRRVQVLLAAAKGFHAALFRIHHTEQHGYGGLVDVPGARHYVAVPHRLEMRG